MVRTVLKLALLDIVLTQDLADRRIFPALDVAQSATRRIELLQDDETLATVTSLRNVLLRMPAHQAIAELIAKLEKIPSNDAFLRMLSATAAK